MSEEICNTSPDLWSSPELPAGEATPKTLQPDMHKNAANPKVAVQVTIAKLAPIFTAILAALLVAEPLTCMTGAFSSLGIIGVVLVAHPPFLFGGHAAWDSHRLIGESGIAMWLTCLTGSFINQAINLYAVRHL